MTHTITVPAWYQQASEGNWLNAAKTAVLDQGTNSTTMLALALIAAAEVARAHIPSQEQA